ncbi:MAG: hypothetical protein JNL39_18560 [Opitutaceae bacterium]|nr:hypothetical protein [Opitutaceae bacterium]
MTSPTPANAAPTPHRWRRSLHIEWQRPQRATLLAGLAVALIPIAYTLVQASSAWRDVAYWDEISTAVGMLQRLDESGTFGSFVRELFMVTNEHRMVTSRLIYAASYWLTGTVNFTAISVIGTSTIVLLFATLVATAGDTARRVRMAVVMGCLLFQLEHFENFYWSGASIDHFQVVFLAALAVVAVARGTTGGAAAGALFALLATFTLTHGTLVWPIGAVMLWRQNRLRAFALWCSLTALTAVLFLTGFQVNASQSFAALSVEGGLDVLTYWLRLLGAVPALDYGPLEPVLGAVLLALIVKLVRGGALRREPIALPLVFFAVGALAMIAIGRTAEMGGLVSSRYYVLSALAWGLTLFTLMGRYTRPRAPLRLTVAALPLLTAFNIVANQVFVDKAESWVESRDRAATRYKKHGVDGQGPFKLFPVPTHSTAVLAAAERSGVYRMGSICRPISVPKRARETTGLLYYIEKLEVDRQALFVEGWAAFRGWESEPGQLHLLLRSPTETLAFTTVGMTRDDVAKAHAPEPWKKSGFRFVRRRERLPTGEFQIGLMFIDGGKVEYCWTAHSVILKGDGEAKLATGG